MTFRLTKVVDLHTLQTETIQKAEGYKLIAYKGGKIYFFAAKLDEEPPSGLEHEIKTFTRNEKFDFSTILTPEKRFTYHRKHDFVEYF